MEYPSKALFSASKTLIWWVMLFITLFYFAFAVDQFLAEFNFQYSNSVREGLKERNTPIGFLIHTSAGSIGFLAGIFQFNSWIRVNYSAAHKLIGWIYVITILTTSLTGIWISVSFEVPTLAKAVFWVIGVVWFISTFAAFLFAIKKKFVPHRNWMIRSYAITLFFMTFGFWVPSMQDFFPAEIAWPLGLTLAFLPNLLVAELIIRKNSTRTAKP